MDFINPAHRLKIRSYVTNLAATELDKLSTPCYYPETKKRYNEILSVCGLTDSQVKLEIKKFYQGTPAAGWLLTKDPQRNMFMFLLNYFQKNNDTLGYQVTMLYYVIREYSNLMNKMIQYCNPNVFSYTLQHLSKTHLFITKKTISGALYHLSNEMQRRYPDFKELDTALAVKFIQESRTRVSKSIKSFAELYYKFSKEGVNIRNPYEGETGEQYEALAGRLSALIDNIVTKVTVYKYIDQKALTEAKKLSKIGPHFSEQISKELCNTKFSDQLRSVYQMFLKEVKDIKFICGDEFYKYVDSLISVKRTTKTIYFKQQLTLLLEGILTESNLMKEYSLLTPQTKYMVLKFTAYYTSIILRNTIC